MPFLRFSRDKRGYEHTYLVHTANRRGKPSRPRILYWYRTPPGVRVGRKPFDDEVRRAIEAQHPGVPFDWESFAKAQIPAAEPEPWWEKRRAERAAKQARRADGGADETQAPTADAEGPEDLEPAPGDVAPAMTAPDTSEETGERQAAPAPPAGLAEGTGRKRRRRGGRRRRGPSGVPGEEVPGPGSTQGPVAVSAPDAEAQADGDEFDPGSSEE